MLLLLKLCIIITLDWCVIRKSAWMPPVEQIRNYSELYRIAEFHEFQADQCILTTIHGSYYQAHRMSYGISVITFIWNVLKLNSRTEKLPFILCIIKTILYSKQPQPKQCDGDRPTHTHTKTVYSSLIALRSQIILVGRNSQWKSAEVFVCENKHDDYPS